MAEKKDLVVYAAAYESVEAALATKPLIWPSAIWTAIASPEWSGSIPGAVEAR